MAVVSEQDPTTYSSSISERAPSRHSSIQGPYRDGLKETSFPIYRTVESPGTVTDEIYARSLLGTGNGMPLGDVRGSLSRPQLHLKNGALLGDVGYVNESGSFHFAFNIFSAADHPLHKYGVPPTFSPFHLGISKDDSTLIPDYHPPGTVITSPGITVTQAVDPLAIQFDSKAIEGAVLVLPSGASREDLVDPSRLYPYLKKHAASWYQYYNGNNERTAPDRHTANGTLCIVTGVDRVVSWAMATFYARDKHVGEPRRFRYIANSRDSPWKDDTGSTLHERKSLSDGTLGVVFLRVVTVALSAGEWSRNVAYIPPEEVQSYTTLSTRVPGLGSQIRRVLPRFRFFSKELPTRTDTTLIFHPSIVLSHILVLTDLSATVAVVPDSVWCSQLSGQPLTHEETVILIRKIIDNFDIVTEDGVATFIPRDKDHKDITPRRPIHSTISSYIRWIIPWSTRSKPKDTRTKALENMKKVLSI